MERSFNYRAMFLALLIGLTYLLFPLGGEAAVRTEFGDALSAHTAFNAFLTGVGGHVNGLLSAGSNAALFVNAEFITFASYRLIVAVGKYAVSPYSDITDVFSVIMLIAIVQILIDFYGILTSGLLEWANDFAGVIQNQVVGNDHVFYATNVISAMLDKITFVQGAAWYAILPSAIPTALIISTYIILWALSLIAFVGTAWAVWGFVLAKLIGWFFVPFMLIDRLAPLFDGWLKFMVGFLIYAVIIRVNTVLIVVMLESYFGLVAGALDPLNFSIPPITIVVDSFANVGGFLALLLVALLSIISTGTFATAIAGGVGGFGQAVSGVARMASGVAVLSRMGGK